jgi:hypothetical protein
MWRCWISRDYSPPDGRVMAQNGNCVLSQRSMGAALERREQGAGSVGIAFT